jgi:hypothetical protein
MNRYLFARKSYLQAFKLLFAQQIDDQRKSLIDSPRIIMPGEPLVQKAVNKLLQLDPNYFRGASEIKVKEESAYGHVESGPGKDPSIIYVNIPRIKKEVAEAFKKINPNATQAEIDEEVVRQLILTITHERVHIGDLFKSESNQSGFKPEFKPESEAQRIEAELASKL